MDFSNFEWNFENTDIMYKLPEEEFYKFFAEYVKSDRFQKTIRMVAGCVDEHKNFNPRLALKVLDNSIKLAMTKLKLLDNGEGFIHDTVWFDKNKSAVMRKVYRDEGLRYEQLNGAFRIYRF